MEDKKFIVYVHTAPNGKKYVGITSKTAEQRWHGGKGYRDNKHFKSAIQKYGWDNFTHEILHEGVDKDTAIELERFYIEKYNSDNPKFGYNKTKGGFGRLGDHLSKRARKAISEKSKKNWQNPEFRTKVMKAIEENPYHHTEETKQKLREINQERARLHPEQQIKYLEAAWEANKGREPWNKNKKGVQTHSPETRQKISEGNKGKKLSEETKKKIGEKSKGRKMSEENRQGLIERNKNMSIETRQKIANSVKQKWKDGCFDHLSDLNKNQIPWNKGKKCPQLREKNNSWYGQHHTEESRKKMSMAQKKRFETQPVWNRIKVQCIETGEIYDSIKQAQELSGAPAISLALKSGGKSGGYHWRRL